MPYLPQRTTVTGTVPEEEEIPPPAQPAGYRPPDEYATYS